MEYIIAIFFFIIAIINIVLAVLSWQEKLAPKESNKFYALPEEKRSKLFQLKAKVNTGRYFLVADICILLGVYQIYRHELLKMAIVIMAVMILVYFLITSIYIKKKA